MDECNTRENMKVDAFQKVSKPVKPPAVPPKSPSLYRTTRNPDSSSSPTVSPTPFPRSPTLPRTPLTPHYMAPQQNNSLDSPSTDDDCSVTKLPVPPRPVLCAPPVPPKTKSSVYLHPNVLTSTDNSDGGQAPSPVSFSSTESELRPRTPTALRPPPSPSEERRSPAPHSTQANYYENSVGVERPVSPRPVRPPPVPPKTKSGVYLTPSSTSAGGQAPSPVTFSSTESELRPRPPPSPSPAQHSTQPNSYEEVVAVENSPRPRSPQPPTPAPRTRQSRHMYQTTQDISTGSTGSTQNTPSATHHTPEDTPSPVQVPRIHVTSQQPDEYDTPSSANQISTGPPVPPPVPPKTKTRDRPQLTTTTEQYDRPTPPKPAPRPASHPHQYYQTPTSSREDANNVNTTEDRDYQTPRSTYPASEAYKYADRFSYLGAPSPVPRDGNSYRPNPSGSSQQTPELKPELSPAYESIIYEPIDAVAPQAMGQLTAPSGSGVSPHSSRPPPPSFSPPPPPQFSPLNSPLCVPPMGLGPYTSRAYLQVLPGDSGYQDYSPSGTLRRSQSETLLDKKEGGLPQEQWRKTMELLEPTNTSRYRPMTAEEKTRWINQTAQRVRKALTYFQSMLPGRRDMLRWHISELKDIADKLEKKKKRHRMMGTGAGTTGAVGGVAAVVGIALAPLTMGASLVATAVGAGMAVAAGGMGASSAVKKKKSKSADQKRVEEIMRIYRDQVIDLEDSLSIVRIGMEELRRHGLAGASEEAVWMARVAEAAFHCAKTDRAKPTLLSAEDILKDFDAVSEVYYSSSDSDKQKEKKGSENKFTTRVSTAAQQLQDGLNDMNCAWETFSLATASV